MPLSPAASAPPLAAAPRSARARAAAVWALTKPRLALMSLLTTLVAYATAHPPAGRAGATLLGTALAAAGALSLNQWWERRTDALMQRTRGRPLPLASLTPGEAFAWSILFSVTGTAVLALGVNLAAAACAVATILLYGVVYTPLKRRTRWATEIGSLSGALPALLGNAAAGDLLARPGLALTAILLLWQMPHFFAIGWRHRADYRAAGFPLLPAVDPTGARTAAWSFGYAVALAIVSLVPCALGWFGLFYAVVTLAANAWFLRCAWRFLHEPDRDRGARSLFFASLVYLPLVMGALLAEQLPVFASAS